MTKMNRPIARGILVLSYMVIISLIIYGISAVIGYLNTGADRSRMLNVDVQKIEQYIPEVNWLPLNNIGRVMSKEMLNQIEENYLDAWYVRHVALKTNSSQGIADYYTENSRTNIFSIIDTNKQQEISIQSTTLEHHPEVNLLSEDGQLVVLTDHDVIEYKRVYQKDKLLIETKERSTYKIIMLLEDGFWRIRHLVKEKSAPVKQNITSNPSITSDISGLNYYPQATPWDMYGDLFNRDTIANDFELIRSTGLNSIRIFVPYEDFGKANPQEEKLEKLETVLDIAQEYDIKVVVTLFDFYGDYRVLDWSLNMQHAKQIITKIKSHPALLAWDVKNEPDLDFESRGKTNVVAWLEHMISHIKALDNEHPVTVGWSDPKWGSELSHLVDFVSFHYYGDLSELEDLYYTLKSEVPNKLIAMTEFGMSSYNGFWNPFGNSEADQAEYHKEAQKIIKALHLPALSWTLYDFENIPQEVVGKLPWRRQIQKQFGFIDADGNPKASFKYMSQQ